MIRERLFLHALLLPAVIAAGCSGEGARPDTASLARVFADRAGEVLGGRSHFAATGAGFTLASDTRAPALRATLPARGQDAIRLETARGLAVEVREEGASGDGVLDGAAVAYARDGGTSWWRAAREDGSGVEEWLLFAHGAPTGEPAAAWEIGGGMPRQAGAAVEIADAAGVARLRVTAPIAYAASGQPAAVSLQVEGQRVSLFVDGAPPGPVLVDPTWTSTSAMSVARQAHTATLLADGRVLVAGGDGAENYATAEIYDPAEQAFSPAATMAAPRVDHFAVLLGKGQVLAAGGDGLDTAELYDPTADAWSMVGALSQVRTQAAGVMLSSGQVLLTGGFGVTADLYDPTKQAWQPAASMAVARRAHTATRLMDGRVLVAGGITQVNGNDTTTSAAEIYDPTADAWTETAPMSAARAQHTATALADGRVLVAGGTSLPGPDSFSELSSVEIYDPTAGTWEAAPPMASERAEHTAAALANGAVLVAGGLDATDSALPTAELFAPDAAAPPGVWVSLAPMAANRILHTATLLLDATVLVAGGEQQSSAEVFAAGTPGAPCAVADQCQSGLCVDGVCCTSACGEPCHSCALPDAGGTCTPAGAGTDPRDDCGDGGACDLTCGASGACTSRVGATCTPGGCGPGETTQFPAATCTEGTATCPIVVEPCAEGYRCDADAGACRVDCRAATDCAPGYACDPSYRCVLPPAVAGGDAPSCDLARGGGAASGSAALLAAVALGYALRKAREGKTRAPIGL